MSETKTHPWTPGPWAPGHMTDPETTCECRYILSDGAGYFGSVAVVSKSNGLRVGEGGNDCPPEEEAIANAHLIAAAPELYEALQRMVNHFTMLPPDYLTTPDSVIGQALSALSRARGEAS
jgi:hypothetical protein